MKTLRLRPARLLSGPLTLVAASVALLGGCAHRENAAIAGATPTTHLQQQAMTPQAARARLVAGNERFVEGRSIVRDFRAEVRQTSGGQYPFAVVLACIDSRSAPEIVFDQGLGDLFVPRVAGNYAPDDLLGSMEFATKVAGARLVVVLGHSGCGAVKGACDGVELGNLTTVMHAIRPAVERVRGVPGPRDSSNAEFVELVTEENVRLTVERIRTASPIMRELEAQGAIAIVGAIYEIDSGRVWFLDDGASG